MVGKIISSCVDFFSSGGFKLELLDKNDNVLRDLTPEGLFVGEEDNTVSIRSYCRTVLKLVKFRVLGLNV